MSRYTQPLNSIDRFELDVHDVFRSVGHPGLKLQLLLWLQGPLEVEVLQAAADRVARRFPVAASRLDRGCAAWVSDAENRLTVESASLTSSDDDEVWRAATALIERAVDLAHDPPLSLHLLRRPAAGDVLVVEWVHPLMDGKAGELLLQELNSQHLAQGDPDPTDPLTEDEPRARVRKFSWMQRIKALRELRRGRSKLPAVMGISRERIGDWTPGPLRLSGRSLDAECTSMLASRARELCGFPNLTPLLTAAAYRALSRIAPAPPADDAIYRAPVPINLRRPGAGEPIFRNLMAYLRLHATHAELRDRDELVRLLNRRMRDQVARRADLGSLTMMTLAAGSRIARRRSRRRPPHWISMGLAHMGTMPADLATFCGVAVEREYFLTSLTSPPGMGISTSICDGRLHVSMTHVTAELPEERAEAFLDEFVGELSDRGARD